MKTYPADTDVVYSELKNGRIQLKAQKPRVQAALRQALLGIFYGFCTQEDYALPSGEDLPRGWIRDTLGAAAFSLEDLELEDRIYDVDLYARTLCDIVSVLFR